MTNDDEVLSPAEMLALASNQQRSMEGQVASFVPALVTMWGVVWLFGFGALWLIDGLKPSFALPLPVAVTIFVVLLVVAIAMSAVWGSRSGRGIRRDAASAFSGVVYGSTWTVGSLAIFVFAQGLAVNGMSMELANIFYPVAYVLFAGIMYIVGAAIWQAVPMLILGVWTVIVAVIAPFFGYPTHYLVLAIGGGAGFLLLGAVSFIHLGRLRRSTTGSNRG
ncbi:hypothetical protein [Microbacterium sp. A93]|uniref:hypothetical protein n=1 Tax=Microbacterium sp. A93 TaxID=3450716 RepID=UPI003F423602